MKKALLMPLMLAGVFTLLSFTQKDTGPGDYDCEITIDASLPRLEMSSDMYGIFFEDINHASDGGLYAELIQNRDFEADRTPENITFVNNDSVGNSTGWRDKYKRPAPLHAWS
jgi:hypothetical protein